MKSFVPFVLILFVHLGLSICYAQAQCTITCPQSIPDLDANDCCQALLGNYTALAQVSGCNGPTTVTQSPLPSTTINPGTVAVILTATDGGGQTATCVVNVTIAGGCGGLHLDCAGIHWTYEGDEGPEHWDELCCGYLDCGGPAQSPVDIVNAVPDAGLGAIGENYHESATHILNNGHTIQFNYDAGSEITVNGIVYKLLQFHFHTHSEHTVGGTQYPMEVHLVHKDMITGKLAVIGIFFEEGAENPLLEEFMAHLPEHHDETYDAPDTYEVADLLPASDGYYTYPGSLTTPPCSQIVNWLVLKSHITASHDQIHEIELLEHENNRPVQPLNGRTIYSFH